MKKFSESEFWCLEPGLNTLVKKIVEAMNTLNQGQQDDT